MTPLPSNIMFKPDLTLKSRIFEGDISVGRVYASRVDAIQETLRCYKRTLRSLYQHVYIIDYKIKTQLDKRFLGETAFNACGTVKFCLVEKRKD